MNQTNVSKQWAECLQKGSVLLSYSQPPANDEQGQLIDRIAGFRNRLANKFAWMYGYRSSARRSRT